MISFLIARIGELEQRISPQGQSHWWQCSIIADASNGIGEFENDYIAVMLSELETHFKQYHGQIWVNYVGKYADVIYEFLVLFENHEDAILFTINHGMKTWTSN